MLHWLIRQFIGRIAAIPVRRRLRAFERATTERHLNHLREGRTLGQVVGVGRDALVGVLRDHGVAARLAEVPAGPTLGVQATNEPSRFSPLTR